MGLRGTEGALCGLDAAARRAAVKALRGRLSRIRDTHVTRARVLYAGRDTVDPPQDPPRQGTAPSCSPPSCSPPFCSPSCSPPSCSPPCSRVCRPDRPAPVSATPPAYIACGARLCASYTRVACARPVSRCSKPRRRATPAARPGRPSEQEPGLRAPPASGPGNRRGGRRGLDGSGAGGADDMSTSAMSKAEPMSAYLWHLGSRPGAGPVASN